MEQIMVKYNRNNINDIDSFFDDSRFVKERVELSKYNDVAYIINSVNVDMRTSKGQAIKELKGFLKNQRIGDTPRLRMRIPKP